MDIHRKSVDMDINMDRKFHIHGKPENFFQICPRGFFSQTGEIYAKIFYL